MARVGSDVSAARSLTMSYEIDKHRRDTQIESQKGEIAGTAKEFGQIASGVPLEQIQGTDQYTKSQAQQVGNTISIQNVNLSKDYPWNNFLVDAMGGKSLHDSRVEKGIRTSPG